MSAAVDQYVLEHLAAYCARSVFEDEVQEFTAYALAAVNDDPVLLQYGWPPLYRSFVNRKN